jgi:hypothetical protein
MKQRPRKWIKAMPKFRDRDFAENPIPIYFIQAESGPIKIGYADDIYKRLNAMQSCVWENLSILSWFWGSPTDEQRLHAQYAHLNIRGEWFRPDQELLDHIAALDAARSGKAA